MATRLTDVEKLMGEQLRAAGWKKTGRNGDVWNSPNTPGLYLKRKKAWQLMQARKAICSLGAEALELFKEASAIYERLALKGER